MHWNQDWFMSLPRFPFSWVWISSIAAPKFWVSLLQSDQYFLDRKEGELLFTVLGNRSKPLILIRNLIFEIEDLLAFFLNIFLDYFWYHFWTKVTKNGTFLGDLQILWLFLSQLGIVNATKIQALLFHTRCGEAGGSAISQHNNTQQYKTKATSRRSQKAQMQSS